MEIKNASFIASNSDYRKCPVGNLPEYAFIGRSNVGKSSLVNMLTGRKRLAKTSQMPGKTQLINHFIINNEWYLVDLPGYGYARRGEKGREDIRRIIESYILAREALTCLFVLIDCRHEPQKSDLAFMEWLGENGIPFAVIFTKADKIGKSRLQEHIRAYSEKMLESWEELPPMLASSAETRTGKDEILDYIDTINRRLKHADSEEAM
ncbi:MAG: ribosome biogenesis GTP-binding protein YihA/YsxC [Tannerella sp.]|jgi:GTP-binding protein|nr:ribosome biogenesis GTP-binding protein YihA/YsxC [Tannerella sp.]